ncbi:glycosyltransferase 87 family protein [Actinoallomurus sp. CA-150999]|uniref:glycosyltransferase 87 family protein n=1 Tax=Actinoallomurus sp. CA-150999 TaxID=3239887 RepID=UPI003D913446
MDHPEFTAFVLVAGLLLAAAAQWRDWRPSLRTALGVGIGLRLTLLISASTDSWQPVDFNEGFRAAGQAILHHQDPVLASQGSWHFLPMIPYFYALALATGLPWEIAGRLCTIVADVVLIVLVGRLAGRKHGAAARFQYACNPIALMIAVIHAQVEPISLVFLVAAYLLARSARNGAENGVPGPNGAWAGALFGFALSAKSWPIILLPVVLAMLPNWRQRLYGLVAAGAVPVFFLVTLPLVVSSSWADMLNVARYLGEVRPIVGEWGWTALMTHGNWTLAPMAAKVGQLILYSTIALVIWLWWRADRIDQTSAILLAFMVVTPRMGAQYLLWFVPFLCARPTRWSRAAMTVGAVWAGIGYIYLTQFDDTGWWENHSWWAMSSVAIIPLLVLAMPWARRRPKSADRLVTPDTELVPVAESSA